MVTPPSLHRAMIPFAARRPIEQVEEGPVWCGDNAETVSRIGQVGVELALWRRGVGSVKGCGWTRSAYETGIVHRSPRIAGTGLTRLVLVLNPPHHFHWEQRP